MLDCATVLKPVSNCAFLRHPPARTVAQSSVYASKCSMHSTQEKSSSPVSTKLGWKKARVGVTPELAKLCVKHSIKNRQQFVNSDVWMVRSNRLSSSNLQTLKWYRTTTSIDEPHDVQDEAILFGDENLDSEDDIESGRRMGLRVE